MASFLDALTNVSLLTWIAVVAVLGYLVGRWRRLELARSKKMDRQEIARALAVSQEMEHIANRLLGSLATHLPAVDKFNVRLARWERGPGVSRDELSDRTDELLKPVLQLSSEISRAYAELLQQMAHLSMFAEMHTDPLTGVANRRAFDESLDSSLRQFARYGAPLSLVLLDIDHFKKINDDQGHLHGDQVLQELGALLSTSVRDVDVLARYGGEEFVILMPHTELYAACPLTERIRAAAEQQLGITVSMGVASAQADDTPTTLIARADAALYAAKDAGRNRVFLHEGQPGRIVGIKHDSYTAAAVDSDVMHHKSPLLETADAALVLQQEAV